MKTLIRIAALSAVISISAAAQAVMPSSVDSAQNDSTKFDFSYNFDDNQTINGSFFGRANGNLITNVSNMQATFNNQDLSFYYYSQFENSGSPVISFDGKENNFDVISSFDYSEFAGIADEVFASGPTGIFATSLVNVAEWHVATAKLSPTAAEVPELETYVQMLAGLVALGLIARCRKSL